MCRIGLPRFSWSWVSLRISVEVLEITVIWASCLFVGTSQLCRSFLWNLAPHMEFVILGHLFPCFNLFGDWSSNGYRCLWLACFLIAFSSFWYVVLGWFREFLEQCDGACHRGEWMWPHRTFVLPNTDMQLLCILTQRNHAVMSMLGFRFPCYFDWHNLRHTFLGNGSGFVPGSAASLSVAPFGGEQPWLIALGILIPFFHGSMMRISLPEIFSFNPLSVSFDGIRPPFYGSFCGKVRIFLFKHPLCFGFLQSSQPGTCALDDSLRKRLKCL